jgi:hypothetical protein
LALAVLRGLQTEQLNSLQIGRCNPQRQGLVERVQIQGLETLPQRVAVAVAVLTL